MARLPATVQEPVTQEPDRYESWVSALDVLGVQYLFLDTERDIKLLQIFQTNPGWSLDFSDGESVVFARTGSLAEVGTGV